MENLFLVYMPGISFYSVNFIRKSWINFFQDLGFFFLSPVSLLPEKEDKSLLFVNSGVSTLKKFFKNPELLPAAKIVNCQPVIRTLDIKNVNNPISFHQTLFEMLGIFSFGDLEVKKNTILAIWNWLVGKLKIDSTCLFVTLWENDLETLAIWSSLFAAEHIFFGGKKTNFWDMGDGPCGPSTEIYFCLDKKTFPKKIEDLEKKTFLEIGNIVFPEFYHLQDGSYNSLTDKWVDVGLGLERLAMIKQKKESVFLIDLWDGIFSL